MAVVTHTWGITLKSDAGTVGSTSAIYTSDAEINMVETVLASVTNMEADIAITVANIQSVMLISDKDLTVKTNSTTTPQETITLSAGKMVKWTKDDPTGAKPFAGNITKFYLTNAGSTTATFKLYCLLDQTA